MKISFPHISHCKLKTLTSSNPNDLHTSSSSFRLPLPQMAPPPTPPRISIWSHHNQNHHRRQTKIIVVMGPTGSGKSRLSIDLATRYFPSSEIINCDKVQLYRGLDITTNKIPTDERNGVVHHLLGQFDTELSALDYRSVASVLISDVVSRRKVPFLVGGSNSYIHALLAERFDPRSDDADPFFGTGEVASSLRYNCCFLWVDVAVPVLNEYLLKRVDEMMTIGMFEELEAYFSNAMSQAVGGINRAIGVPEFEEYFRKYPRREEEEEGEENGDVARERIECYARAVKAIKDNTCQLAKRQIEKIQRLRKAGWDLQKFDGTAAVMDVMKGEDTAAWERDVVEPCVKVVKRFLVDE